MKQILLIAIPVVILIAVILGIYFYKRNDSCCHTSVPPKPNDSSVCNNCGKNSCDIHCSASKDSKRKEILPSCSLGDTELTTRLEQLQTGIFSKAKSVNEIETGYELTFVEPKEFSEELLQFVNFERGCCSNFTYALIFEPNNKATHLQIYGSAAIKEELRTVLVALGM